MATKLDSREKQTAEEKLAVYDKQIATVTQQLKEATTELRKRKLNEILADLQHGRDNFASQLQNTGRKS